MASVKAVDQRTFFKKKIIGIYKYAKSVPETTQDQEEITTRIDMLEKYWAEFVARQMEIELVCGPAEIDMQNIEMEDTEKVYCEAMVTLKKHFNRIRNNQQQIEEVEVEEVPVEEVHVENQVTINSTRCNVRLPRIEIPKFDGKIQSWQSFCDTFTALVGHRTELSAVEKLHYLKGNVEGEAQQLIRSYQITDGNYQEAWNALVERYDNKRLIINSHIKTLMSQSPILEKSFIKLRQLLDNSSECIGSLRVLGEPTERWDSLVIYTLSQKLDPETHSLWEESLNNKRVPTQREFFEFVEKRCHTLEAISVGVSVIRPTTKTIDEEKRSKHRQNPQGRSSLHITTSNCSLCSNQHKIYSCPEFIKLPVDQRTETSRKLSLCFNCLQPRHSAKKCKSGPCRVCSRYHHTLLHRYQTSTATTSIDRSAADQHQRPSTTTVAPGSSSSTINTFIGLNEATSYHVLLSTALVKIKSGYGSYETARALLDSGSEGSFITENCVQRLRLRKKPASIEISGLGSSNVGMSQGVVLVEINSTVKAEFTLKTSAIVMSKLTNALPSRIVDTNIRSRFNHLMLADPRYFEPGPVDIILGADVYSQIIMDGIIRGLGTDPVAQKTSLGWILFGPIESSINYSPRVNLHCHLELESSLNKFWEIEEVGMAKHITQEDRLCEKHYEDTHKRDRGGRYIVSLPFSKNPQALGNSRASAISRLLQLERKFLRDPQLKVSYLEFMKEYESLGHMKIAIDSPPTTPNFFLPHHGVIKKTDTTTKLRVVFDASCKSSSGTSLNEIQLIGPRLQDDLFNIILRFRRHQFAMSADIVKMYRQIWVDKDHWKYQNIVWRADPADEIQNWQLKTVTYGMAAAPYMAIKSLQQLARRRKHLPFGS